MLIAGEKWHLRFDGQRGDPNIVDRNHRAALLEIEINASVDCGSDRRNVQHLPVSNDILDSRPGGVAFCRLKNSKTQFRECNKGDSEILIANHLFDLWIAPKQADNYTRIGYEIDPFAVHGTCSKASPMCLSNLSQSSEVIFSWSG
jgi:hypothetical protein